MAAVLRASNDGPRSPGTHRVGSGQHLTASPGLGGRRSASLLIKGGQQVSGQSPSASIPHTPSGDDKLGMPRVDTDPMGQPQQSMTFSSIMGSLPVRGQRSNSVGLDSATATTIGALDARLDAVAGGDLQLSRRTVTKDELRDAKALVGEVRKASFDGKDYEEAARELDKETASVMALRQGAEKELATLQKDNDRLRKAIEDTDKKLRSREQGNAALVKKLKQYEVKEKALQDEKLAVESVVAKLLEEIEVLKENLSIQETNVDRLKELAERLQEDIARAQKRQEETQEKHRLAILRMETEIAKDVDELQSEYSEKEAELRSMLDKSQDMRQKAEDDWREREARMAKMAKEEVRSKNEELQKLRAKIEQLLREQIDAMRDRVSHQSKDGVTKANPKRHGMTGKTAPRDLAVQTHEVLSEVAAGRRILTVSLSSRSGNFRAPVSWEGRGPRHYCDAMAEDIAVQLAVDQRMLHPIPDAARRGGGASLTALLHNAGGQGEEWRFATAHGTELVVAVRLLPPGVP